MGRKPNGRARAITEAPLPRARRDAAHLVRSRTTDGPTLLFLSGLGGGFGVWRPFVERFGARCRLVGWDYRGLYESGAPASRGR